MREAILIHGYEFVEFLKIDLEEQKERGFVPYTSEDKLKRGLVGEIDGKLIIIDRSGILEVK